MDHDPLVVTLKQKGRTPPSAEGAPQAAKPRRYLRPLLLLVAVIVCAGGGYYGYLFMNSATRGEGGSRISNDEAVAEIENTIARVSELIVLPEGEEPTIATVTDPEKLKDQEFFRNAKPGYRVLLYTKARKAYLYDPAAHRLVEVAPITTELQ